MTVTDSQLSNHTKSRASLLWVMLIALAIVVPRAMLITREHTEYWDDQYHILRGVAMLDRRIAGLPLNDPPAGEWIEALPLWAMGVHPHGPQDFRGDQRIQLANVLYGQEYDAEALRMVLAIWKALLFLPMVAVVFIWCRDLYGVAAGWLACGIVLLEPTIAAHISTGALDVLGMEGIVLAIFVADRYVRRPTLGRLVLTGLCCALAMALKHTGLITPAVVALTVLLGRRSLKPVLLLIPVVLLGIWACTLFDVSAPAQVLDPKLIDVSNATWAQHTLPAGVYWGSVANGIAHAHAGHRAFLFGQYSTSGWWYYYPVVASYKIPIGLFIIFAAALITVPFIKARKLEWVLFCGAAAWSLLLLGSHINIGFRHFLPAYIFWIMVSTRILSESRVTKVTLPLAVVCLFGVVLDDARIHPDYLSYINFPRSEKYWWVISDSNVDWGQGMKQVAKWLDAHPLHKEPVYLRRFTDPYDLSVLRYLDRRVHLLTKADPLPKSGLLIISMVHEGGAYAEHSPYSVLRDVKPIAIIGHSMLVYDLDAVAHSQ